MNTHGAAGRARRTWPRACRGVSWREAGLALALVVAAVLATGDAWSDIAHIALRDDEASQVLLAPVVAAWLFWIRRGRLRHFRPEHLWAGPALIVLGWTAYLLGDRFLVQSAWHLGALLVALGALASVLGGGVLVRFGPAVAALAFLVPVPGRLRQAIALPLQAATAHVTQALLDTLGFDVERLGSVLRVNGHEVMVAEACNGLRMVFALVAVSFAFAYGVPLRNGIRMLVLGLSPLTAVAFNVLRLVPVVLGYGYFEEPFANQLHDLSAWVMLPCSFLALLGVTRVLRWAHVPVSRFVLAYGT